MNRFRRQRSHSPKTSAPERSRNEAGFTILELSIVSALLLLVLAAATVMLTTYVHEDAFETARTDAQTNMRVVMNAMTKEIREAHSIDGASTATSLVMHTPVLGVDTTVTYSVSGTYLRRSVTGSNPVVVTRIASGTGFVYVPDAATAQRVSVHLAVHPAQSPDTTLVLDSEVSLRNRS